MTVLSHIFYLWRFKTVKLPWIDHNASRFAQIQDGVAIVEKLNCYHVWCVISLRCVNFQMGVYRKIKRNDV